MEKLKLFKNWGNKTDVENPYKQIKPLMNFPQPEDSRSKSIHIFPFDFPIVKRFPQLLVAPVATFYSSEG